MEMLAEQPKIEALATCEQRKSFDVTASLRMMRYDLVNFGQVLPETRQQACNEELSYLAEGIDRAARTSFALKRINDELVYFKAGRWRPYLGMLTTGLEVAEEEAAADPRRHFQLEWACYDLARGYELGGMEAGERRHWLSAYPHHLAEHYGTAFMADCGLNPQRALGFIYEAECQDDGSVVLRSQTIDRSDPDALAAVSEAIAAGLGYNLDALTGIYDSTLGEKYGTRFSAGRTDSEVQGDAWEAINRQQPLISYHLDGLESLACSGLEGKQLENAVKKHVYGVWATFRKCLDSPRYYKELASTYANHYAGGGAAAAYEQLARAARHNFDEFADRGELLIGCGGTIRVLSGADSALNAEPSDVFSAIFGSKTCPEVKNGQRTTCPHCRKLVRAIVPSREKIFCSNGECKLAAPGLSKHRAKGRLSLGGGV